MTQQSKSPRLRLCFVEGSDELLLYCCLYFSDAHIYLGSISILEPEALIHLPFSFSHLIYDMINLRLYHCGEVLEYCCPYQAHDN